VNQCCQIHCRRRSISQAAWPEICWLFSCRVVYRRHTATAILGVDDLSHIPVLSIYSNCSKRGYVVPCFILLNSMWEIKRGREY